MECMKTPNTREKKWKHKLLYLSKIVQSAPQLENGSVSLFHGTVT